MEEKLMEKKRYVLTIGRQEIAVKSSDSEQYLEAVSDYVNEMMKGFKKASPNISVPDLYALCCLSLGDELFKARRENESIKGEIDTLKKELSDSLGRLMMLEADEHEMKLSGDRLNERIDEIEKLLIEKAALEDSFKEKLNVLSYELQKPHGDRDYKEHLAEANKLLGKMMKSNDKREEEEPAYVSDSRQLSLYDIME